MVVSHFSDFINLLEKKSWVFKDIRKRSIIKLKCVDYFFTKWQLYGYKKNISWNSSKIWWIMGWPFDPASFIQILWSLLIDCILIIKSSCFCLSNGIWNKKVLKVKCHLYLNLNFLFSVYLNRLLYMFILKKNYSA